LQKTRHHHYSELYPAGVLDITHIKLLHSETFVWGKKGQPSKEYENKTVIRQDKNQSVKNGTRGGKQHCSLYTPAAPEVEK